MTDKEALEKVLELTKMPAELEWFELKANQANPQEIGEYISAMSNTADGFVQEAKQGNYVITNMGAILLAKSLDHSPRSRNERLASFLRRANICEERGSGIDKVFIAVEAYQLPPPEFQVMTDSTRIILFGLREHSGMTTQERVWACYWHAVLLHVNGRNRMTNTTLRKRLGIDKSNYPWLPR